MELPLEIWDIVIDHLHSDKQSLVACGLTCKAWVIGSQFHLFRRIYLRTRNIHGFLDILRSSSNPGSYVRRVDISDGLSSTFNGKVTTWVSEVLPVLMNFLPNVMELDIRCGFLDDVTRGLFASGFQKVEALTIWQMTFETFAQTAEFIASFVALKRLVCHVIVLRSPDNYEGIFPICPRGLHTLRWCMRDPMPHIFDFFLGQRRIPNIHTLTLTVFTVRCALGAGRLLRRLGSNLEHLTISYPSLGESQVFSSDNIDLSYNTRLRSLHLDDLNLQTQWNFQQSWDWIPTILSKIVSSQIEEIHFDFVVDDAGELDVLDWARIDRIIGRLFTIKKISLSGAIGELANPIRMRLPILETRGVIHLLEE